MEPQIRIKIKSRKRLTLHLIGQPFFFFFFMFLMRDIYVLYILVQSLIDGLGHSRQVPCHDWSGTEI